MTRNIHALLAFLLLFSSVIMPSSAIAADTLKANDFLKQVERLLEDPIPEIFQVLPGYNRPPDNDDGLIVGTFFNQSSDSVNWGLLISEIIRVNLYSLPSKPIDIGDFRLSVLKYDSRSSYFNAGDKVDLSKYESLVTLGQRFGIDRVLTGSIKNQDGYFKINVSISSITTDYIVEKFIEFKQNDMKAQIRALIKWIYLQLGGLNQLDIDQIEKIGPDNVGLLKGLAKNLDNIFEQRTLKFPDEFNEKLELEPNFPLANVYQILLENNGNDVFQHNQTIEKLAAKHPDFQAIQTAANLSQWHYNQAALLQSNILGLQKIIRLSPVEYAGFLKILNSLIDYGRPLEALAVAKEQILRWPSRHRSWWQLSYSLEKLAWYYRGTDFWHNVPEKSKLMFKELLVLSKQAIDVAIELHPSSGAAYGERIGLHGGYKGELYQDFLKAIQYDPLTERIYRNALIFSSEKWGGNKSIQNKIYEAARENNLPELELNNLKREFIDPNKKDAEILFANFLQKIGLPTDYFQSSEFKRDINKNKNNIFLLGIFGLFLLSVFLINRSNKRKANIETIKIQFNNFLSQINELKDNIHKKQGKLFIIESQEYGVVLPQIEHYYFLFLSEDGVKIDSHFGVVNGDFEQASLTVCEVIEAAVNKYL